MAQSPLEKAVGVVRLIITSDGKVLDENFRVDSVTIDSELNKIPHASFSIIDGDVPKQDMPASNEKCLWPGAKIKIETGYDTSIVTLFEGIIIKQGVQISGSSSTVQITCKDEAIKMDAKEKSTTFSDLSDSDVIKKLISGNSLSVGSIKEAGDKEEEKVQSKQSDWAYMLKLAESNGLLVYVKSAKINAQPIKPTESPVLTLTYGVDIESFNSELDATDQIPGVDAVGWDMASQKTIEASGKVAGPIQQGAISRKDLSKITNPKNHTIFENSPTTEKKLQGLADAYIQRSELKRLTGSISFQGTDDVVPGNIIEIKGVGRLYSGKAFVSSVSHSISNGNWKTTAKFGVSKSLAMQFKSNGNQNGNVRNNATGLLIGKVTKLDEDPDGESRIQVEIPFYKEDNTIWARMSNFYSSNSFGAFFIPEIDDEVVMGFFNNDPSQPVILGSMYSSKLPPKEELTADNNIKSILTRSELKLEFDEEKKSITLETPGGNKVVLSDDAKSILLEDLNSNKVELGTGGITLDSPKDITIKAKGKIIQEATTGMELTSKASFKVKGLSVEQSADTTMTVKGTASAEFSAAGQTTVKGAMVMIN